MRRTFVLQLYARVGSGVAQPSGGVPEHVRKALCGFDLPCPRCGTEPECTRLDTSMDTHSVFGTSGQTYGHQVMGPPLYTLDAVCRACRLDLRYEWTEGREPLVTQAGDHIR